MSAHVVCGFGLHVRMAGDISSAVIGIKKLEGRARQRTPERFRPVAYADSEVGSVPVAAVRRVPPTSNITPFAGGDIRG